MSAARDVAIVAKFFENARDVMLVIAAADGRIVDANRAAELAYGYERAQLLTRTIFDLRVDTPGEVTGQMQRASDDGLLFESLHRRRDGTTFPVEVSSRGETLDGARLLLSVVRDITERRRQEAEREQLMVSTARALALRDEFLIIASHELRTPVTNMSLKLQQLLRLAQREQVHAEVLALAEAAHAENTRLARLITALLDAQLVRGQLALELSEVDLGELVRGAAARMRGHDIVIDIPTIHGRWDAVRLDQVVTNLISNAVKYGRGTTVYVIATVERDQVALEVRDHGIGISGPDASRIFEKFARAVPAHFGGLGLGLYITRQIVEAHRGEITLDSAPGAGSTFRVRLPLSVD